MWQKGNTKTFFANEYHNQQQEDKKWHCNYLLNVPNDDGTEKDGWTKRRFKTVTEALESSNTGYHFDWDEKKFKGKLIGGLFNEREYQKNDGNVGRLSTWHSCAASRRCVLAIINFQMINCWLTVQERLLRLLQTIL